MLRSPSISNLTLQGTWSRDLDDRAAMTRNYMSSRWRLLQKDAEEIIKDGDTFDVIAWLEANATWPSYSQYVAVTGKKRATLTEQEVTECAKALLASYLAVLEKHTQDLRPWFFTADEQNMRLLRPHHRTAVEKFLTELGGQDSSYSLYNTKPYTVNPKTP